MNLAPERWPTQREITQSGKTAYEDISTLVVDLEYGLHSGLNMAIVYKSRVSRGVGGWFKRPKK